MYTNKTHMQLITHNYCTQRKHTYNWLHIITVHKENTHTIRLRIITVHKENTHTTDYT